MYELFLIAGITLVTITACDFFYTTVSFNGAGMMARFVSSVIASAFLWMNKKTRSRSLFRFSGMTHILTQVALWIGLLWIGFFLMLMGDPGSVVDASSGLQPAAINKFYFSGYILSTLGNGEYIPGSPGWQIVVAIFSFAGFVFITTAMTYLMSLTTAVIHKKSLSLFISNLGETPEEIIAHAYDGEGFSRLTEVVPTLQQMINKHNQNHFAHPGVHYFYSRTREESLSINLANLDEALTILQQYAKQNEQLDQSLRPLRDALDKFLKTVEHHFVSAIEVEENEMPNLKPLHDRGIPLADRPAEKPGASERRSLLAGLLQSTGWNWQDIYKSKQMHPKG